MTGFQTSLPRWFTTLLYTATVWCAAEGVTALTLLWRSAYHPLPCAGTATAAVGVLWRFRPAPCAGTKPAHGPATAAIAIGLALFATAGLFHSEHILSDRDPGAYVNTARSIARTHEIFPTMPDADRSRIAFPDGEFSGRAAGFGFSDGRIVPNFYHFLPAIMAAAAPVAGDTGILLVPPLIAAFGLLAVYALASVAVGPWYALLAPALLALAPLQSWFARDAYSELPVQLFALGGAWLLVMAHGSTTVGTGAVAGAVFGTAAFARIDAPLLAAGVPVLIVVQHVRATRRGELRPARVYWAFGITLTIVVAYAHRLSDALSAAYRRELAEQYVDVWLVILASVALAAALWVGSHLRPGFGGRVRDLPWFGPACIGTVASLAAWAYVWRPRPRARLPMAPEGQPADAATRAAIHAWHWSYSVHWFAWYLGLAALVAAFAGIAVLAIRAARGQVGPTVLLATVLPTLVLYVWRPSIASDHLWVMRRFLPVVLPGLAIAVAAAAQQLSRVRIASSPIPARVGAAALVATCLGGAVRAGAPIWQARDQHGALDAVHGVCRAAGDRSAIVVLPYDAFGLILPQAIRGFCGVPAVRAADPTTIDWAHITTEWASAGRDLVVVASGRETMHAIAPTAREIASFRVDDRYRPELTRDRRPSRYDPRPVEIVVFRLLPASP